jgi:hypothetical protein
MHVGEISFCDKVAFNIKSDETKKQILDRLEQKYNIKIIKKHHDKFDDHMTKNINNNPHMICVRSNGNPYFLCLVKHNFTQYCIFIDKKVQQGYFLPRMIIVNLHFKNEAFKDTILEGEMIKMKNGKWVFALNDALCLYGKPLDDVNLPRRVNMMYDFLDASLCPDEYDQFKVCVKSYFQLDEMQYFRDVYLPSLSYTVRGIYIKPLFLKFKNILLNFDDTLVKKVERFKYKSTHGKTFMLKEEVATHATATVVANDVETTSKSSSKSSSVCGDPPNPEGTTKGFWVRKTAQPDVYDMFDESGRCVAVACIPSLKISKKMREIMMDKNLVDKVLLNFEYSEKFNKWIPAIL